MTLLRATALLCFFVVIFATPANGEKEDGSSAEVSDRQLAHEEALAANAQEAMMTLSPLASRTEDALIMAGGQLHSEMTKLADAKARLARLAKKKRAAEQQVKADLKSREQAAIEVSDEQNTLTRATSLVDRARKEEEEEVKYRSSSEEEQGKGVAEEGPAGVLLRDSKQLNRQSNLVLAKSKSTQAKALAALDLKMAESLANRARRGMAHAKEHFSNAIADRQKAVQEANKSAQDAVHAASASLIVNRGDPKLLAVVHGDVAGPKALQSIVAADAAHVDQAETALGETRGSLAKTSETSKKLGASLLGVEDDIDSLHTKLATAQAEVLAAAKAHVAAANRLKSATAENLSEESRVEGLRSEQEAELKAELDDASHAQLHSSSRYEAASAQVDDVRRQRTRLEVRVARLKEELQRQRLERDQARTELSKERERADQLQREADGEGMLLSHPEARTSAGQRGRTEARSPGEGELRDAKEKQAEALQHQAEAVESARAEAASVKAAQEEVAKQLARVNELEASLKS